MQNKITQEEAKAIGTLIVVIVVVVMVLLIFKDIRAGFKSMNPFGESEESKFNKQFGQNPMWNPNTWKTGKKGTLLLKVEQAKNFAAQIANAWGIFNDDEQAVFNVFRQLKSVAQVSEVADFYQLQTGKDLYGDLYHRLSDSELGTINKIVSKLK